MKVYKNRVKYGCYFINFATAMVSIISPLLFLTFNSLYNVSYALMGLLVLVNFTTQMITDLTLSLYASKFNLKKLVKLMPILVVVGFLIYSIFPYFFKDYVYLGLAIGTVLFSISNGLVEVLITPLIEKIYPDNSEKEVSKLHSVYGWGVVIVVAFSTVFLKIFTNKYWQILVLILLVIPTISLILFFSTDIPDLSVSNTEKANKNPFKNKGVWLLFAVIFFAGIAECTMSQWASSYLEKAFLIPKIYGDLFGVALFATMLALGRTLYSKFGKNIEKVLIFGSLLASAFYIVCSLTSIKVLGLISCALTGFAVSMLWPGTLIFASSNNKNCGVVLFALMAAGGDLGAAVGPQLVGSITELCLSSNYFLSLATKYCVEIDAICLRFGLLVTAIFPILCAIFAYITKRYYSKNK